MTKTISSNYALSLLRLAPESEHEDLLAKAGLSFELLASTGEIPIERYNQLFNIVNANVQTEIHSEEDVENVRNNGAMQSILLLLVQSDTLDEALARFHFVVRQLSPSVVKTSHFVRGDTVEWQFDFSAVPEQPSWSRDAFSKSRVQWMGGRFGRVVALYTWHRLASWLIGNYIEIDAVGLADPVPDKERFLRYQNLFGAIVDYNQPVSCLRFHKRYLDSKIKQNADAVFELIRNYPLTLIQVDELRDSMTARVSGLLGSDFSLPLPSLEDVADALNMSASTLHRHLQNENTSLQKIKDQRRKEMAIRYLRDETLSVEDLASLLGFSEKSSFIRAFKRWTDMTPTECRRASSTTDLLASKQN